MVDLSDAGDVDGQQLIGRKKRNAARNRKRVWVTRVIPYEYDSGLPGRTCYTPGGVINKVLSGVDYE